MPRNRPQTIPARKGAAPDPARQRIVEAARAHFFSHGFRHVTMDDLASELAMSKKTVYAHFPSKQALLEAVLAAKFASVDRALSQLAAADRRDFAKTLRALLARIMREMDEIKPPFVRDMRQKTPHLFQTVERRRAAMIERSFGKLFVEGQRAGMVCKDIPARLMIEILLGAVQTIVNPAKIEELSLTPTTAFSFVTGVILKGVLTEAGRKYDRVN